MKIFSKPERCEVKSNIKESFHSAYIIWAEKVSKTAFIYSVAKSRRNAVASAWIKCDEDGWRKEVKCPEKVKFKELSFSLVEIRDLEWRKVLLYNIAQSSCTAWKVKLKQKTLSQPQPTSDESKQLKRASQIKDLTGTSSCHCRTYSRWMRKRLFSFFLFVCQQLRLPFCLVCIIIPQQNT